MTEASLANVGEMIDTAFGDIDKNIVDFKLLEAVLFILGSKLKILQRRVRVELNVPYTTSSTTLSVTEIKVHAKTHKKKKDKVNATSAVSPEDGARSRKKMTIPKSITVQTYHVNVERQTSVSRVKKDQLKLGHKLAPGKSKTDPSLSDKSSSSKFGVKKPSAKTPEKVKPKGKLALEWTMAKHELERDSRKYGAQDLQVEILSDEPTTDILVPTSMSSEKSRTAKPSGSSISLEREEKFTLDFPESEECFPSPLWAWDEPGEIIQENLIIVQRVSVKKTEESDSESSAASRTLAIRPSTVVTAEQFDRLVKSVMKLQTMYGNINIPGVTDNPVFMDILRKSAVLSEGSGAFQLSARLEIVEMALEKLLQLVQMIFNQMLKGGQRKYQRGPQPELDFEDDVDSWLGSEVLDADADAKLLKSPAVAVPSSAKQKRASLAPSIASQRLPMKYEEQKDQTQSKDQQQPKIEPSTDTSDTVTHEELDVAMTEVYEEYTKKIANAALNCHKITDSAVKEIRVIDVQVTKVLEDLTSQMIDIEKVVIDYADKVNDIDMTLSTQMTVYQDELTQMQHDLETGLDTMVEAIANQTSDVEAIAEMNLKFTNLKVDLDTTDAKQKELNEIQDMTNMEIKGLVKDVSDLKEAKCDRDEVAEALSVKADLAALNGMVFMYQYNAVHGDMEKRILDTYDKINSTELTWQKAINELTRQFMDRAEKVQVETFRGDVNNNLQMLKARLLYMSDILGEVKPHNIAKDIFRDEPCLSCDTPGMKEPILNPIVPAFPTSKQSKKPSQFGDNRICYPGMPLPHPIDPRSHVFTCSKYCGGPPNTLERESDHGFFHRVIRDPAIGAGDDANVTHTTQEPCLQCNRPTTRRPTIKISTMGDEVPEEDESVECPWYGSCKYDGEAKPPELAEEDVSVECPWYGSCKYDREDKPPEPPFE